MADWDTAFRVSLSGIAGVFVVMALLQIFTHLSGKAVRWIENRGRRGPEPAEKTGIQE